DDRAVEDVGDRVAVADALQRVPFADRLLGVVPAAEVLDILPERVAPGPVEPALRHCHRRGAGLVVILVVLLRPLAGRPLLGLDRKAALAAPADDDEVAGAALDHLALERLHPALSVAAVRAGAVQQDTAVAGVVLARRPGLLAPLEFDSQVVVLVLALGDEPAPHLAADADHAVADGEDLLGVVVLAVGLLAGLGRGQVG